VLLNSRVTALVTSLEFARKNKFKKKKIERLIYVKNIERMEIDIIGGQIL